MQAYDAEFGEHWRVQQDEWAPGRLQENVMMEMRMEKTMDAYVIGFGYYSKRNGTPLKVFEKGYGY